MRGLILMYTISLSFYFLLLLLPLQTYIWQKKNWALLIDLLKQKNNILYYCVHTEENERQIKRVQQWNGNSYIK